MAVFYQYEYIDITKNIHPCLPYSITIACWQYWGSGRGGASSYLFQLSLNDPRQLEYPNATQHPI